MDASTKKNAIAAALVMGAFCLLAFFLPNIVLWLGGAAAFLFVVAFFGVFWLRGRSRRGK